MAAPAAHREACSGFTELVDQVDAARWGWPTPCTEWDARALVEHVIGFHEFLLLRPLEIRAHRRRHGPCARWRATMTAIDEAHAHLDRLGEPVEYFDGVARPPGELLGALADDVLVHTWDLARAVGCPDRMDSAQCRRALRNAVAATESRSGSGLFGPPLPVDEAADDQARLLALLGRDPSWTADDPRPDR